MKILSSCQNFQWVGKGIPIQKHSKKIRYEAFTSGDLKISIGDFVLVRNDDALDPEDFMSCYVAQVKNLFDTGDVLDPYHAQVQWFSRVLELPTYAIKSVKNVGHELEIIKDKRWSWNNTIDAETIFQKCEVLFLPSDCDFESALSEFKNHLESGTPVFFCRYVFTGIALMEVKNQLKAHPAEISLVNGNSCVNSSTSLKDKPAIDDIIYTKSKSPSQTRERYCAFSVGSPSKIPRVVIKKFDDKILESRTKNVRIFVAESNVESIEDVANIFLNKLKLEKEEESAFEKKPLIHSLKAQNDNTERDIPSTDIDSMDYDSNGESETSDIPQKMSNVKLSIKFNSKFCKNVLAYNTRSSPKKNMCVKSENMCTTPKEKPKVTMLDDLKLKSSNQKMKKFSGENILNSTLVKTKNLEKKCDIGISENNKLKNDNKSKTIGNLVGDVEIDPLCQRRNLIDEKTSHNNQSIKKTVSDGKKISSKKFTELVNFDSNSTPKKKTSNVKKVSPQKSKMEYSASDSTPKKKTKFADGFGDFRLTRSGRRVKSVNYTEEKIATNSISAVTPTKKLPLIYNSYSDDSDTDNSIKCSPQKYKMKKSVFDSTPKKKTKLENGFEEVHVTRSGRRKTVNHTEEKIETCSISAVTPTKKLASISNNYSDDSDTDNFIKCSSQKYKMENSVSDSLREKTKMADRSEDVCLRRSSRRVKAVNYTEEKNETGLISAVTPTKKLPRYISNDYSDDSDNFIASSLSSDDDSLSDLSLLDDISPNKGKRSLKMKASSKKSRNTVNVQRPKCKKNLIDLSIPERKTPLRTPKNALEESRQRLHVSAVPSSLPCRDEEYSDIYSFVKGCLCAQTGGCMYISGVPGTGKTATVHEVMRNLEEEKELGEVPIFTFVEVNGMWMTDPYQCYVQIFKALTGKTIASQQAADLLEKRFTECGPKKDAVVLLVDELDRLWTRKQTVMYNIFDWPTKKNSKLIVLAIANTMDLPERMMMNRISSRLGLTRKTFQPYTFKQLQEIIMSRIQELKVFDPDAVQLVARKVAAVSGDARRALDICRFATETVTVGQTAKKSQKVLVGMEHVDKALQQMFSSPVISAIRSSSKIVKLFFQCIISEFTRSGLEETTLSKVHRQVISTCRFEGLNPPNSTEISRICADLAASHLILVDNFKNDLYMKIRLNISSDDVTYALTLN